MPESVVVNEEDGNSVDKSPTKEDATKVEDPVKAFQEDMEMEGYTGRFQRQVVPPPQKKKSVPSYFSITQVQNVVLFKKLN